MGNRSCIYIFVAFASMGGLSSLRVQSIWKNKKRKERGERIVGGDWQRVGVRTLYGGVRLPDGNFCASNFPSAALDVP